MRESLDVAKIIASTTRPGRFFSFFFLRVFPTNIHLTRPVPALSRDARGYGHTTTAIQDMRTPAPLPPPPRLFLAGVLAFYFGKRGVVDWTDYLDPITSIALSLFIVYCALPVIVVSW